MALALDIELSSRRYTQTDRKPVDVLPTARALPYGVLKVSDERFHTQTLGNER